MAGLKPRGGGDGIDLATGDARYQERDEQGAAGGYPSLDGSGKVPVAQLPALAITEVQTVANQAAQLALTAEEGDVAIRTDEGKTYIHNGGVSGTMADWSEILSPTAAVISVFSRVGAVVSANGDYTATQVTNTPAGTIAAVTVQAALNELDTEKVPTTRTITAGVGLSGGGDLSADRTIDLDDTAVTPGSYTSADITIDAQGRITAAASGAAQTSLVLAENDSVQLDPAGSADGKFTGITMTGTAGAALAFGDVIVLDVDDSRWEKADISVAAAATGDSRGMLGMCVLAAAADGSPTTILLMGNIRADANFPALTIGAAVYASTTGDIVVAQPSTTDYVIRVLGFALTADEIYFNPSQDYMTHV